MHHSSIWLVLLSLSHLIVKRENILGNAYPLLPQKEIGESKGETTGYRMTHPFFSLPTILWENQLDMNIEYNRKIT
jgi:hypothetical protein